MKIFRSVIILVVAVFICISTVYAQEGAGITVVPARIDQPAEPGSSFSKSLKITNESDVEREYFVYKKNIIGVEGGAPLFAEEGAEQTEFDLSEWVTFSTESFRILPGQSVELPIVITVPASASPGSHFGGIFVSVEPPKLRQTGAGVGYEVVSILHIRISGDIIDTARIRSFFTDKLLFGSKNVKFTAKVENQGNILIEPRGPVTITSMFGSKPVVFSVNENLMGVFPHSMRDISFEWNDESLGFGRYEAILALVYNGKDGQKTIDASTIFWVFPTNIMISILGAIIGVVLLGYLFTRYYINKAIMRAAGGRRIAPQRYRKQVGVSRFAFIFTVLLAALVIFLIVLLIFSA